MRAATGSQRVTSLALADRVELGELAGRYAAYVDTRRIDELVELFTPDGVLAAAAPPEHLGPTDLHRGPRQIAAAMDLLGSIPVTQHAVVGHVVEETDRPGVASGRVACIAHHLSQRAGADVRNTVWHLHYLDTYRTVAGQWRFARREMHVDWIETRKVDQWRG